MGEKKQIIVRTPSPENLIKQAIDKGVPVETMERLLAMRRELKAEAAKESYDRALAEFQAECPAISKTKQVNNKDGTKRYSFAALDSIIKQVKPLLKKHGFSYKIDAVVEDKWVTAICKTTHEFGHSESSSFKIPVDPEAFMTAPQKFASALTFAKRYAFCDAFGIMTQDEDDDANSIAGENAKEYDALVKMIGKMNLKVLDEFKAKIQNSKPKAGEKPKYTDDQKAKLIKMVDDRISEMKSAKEKEVGK